MAALESGVTTTVVKPSVTLRVVRPGVPTLRLTTPAGPILHVVAPRAPQLVLPAPRRSTAILVPVPGRRGPAGGDPGPPGPPGAQGTRRYTGVGPPTVVIGARPHDEYLDTSTGDLYTLQ